MFRRGDKMAEKNRIKIGKGFSIQVKFCAVLVLLLAVCLIFTGCNKTETEGNDDSYYGEPVTEYVASSADLYCLEINKYSGPFVEDGQNEQVENVATILVENRSKHFLDYAQVTYSVDGKTATFNVTGLPAGEKAWVLEAGKMVIDGKPDFEFLDCQSTFKKDAIVKTDLLEVKTEDNVLTVKNTGDVPLKNVCVYYKNVNSDGNYLGGITYMLGFDTLEADMTAQRESAHFSDNSRIVRFSYQTE